MGTRSLARGTKRIIRSGLVALLLTISVSRSSSALRPVSDGVARVEARATGGEIVTTCVCELECAPKLNAMKAVVARNLAR
jgi:hypothetical protein